MPAGSRFCGTCGTSIRSEDEEPTLAGTDLRTPTPSQPSGESRFLPGTIIADRYRIFGLLGRGGMGEVYRADDLKLGQAVALKFLPEGFSANQELLDRFLNEVRTARQVAHLNVCRVYDIGEIDGHHYLSMEYVDGEDLASLLRRIGRFPEDKALQIARQLCAGLAAAHNQGILHRDLKPANVMIDGRGGVRITDFGLAIVAESVEGAAAREGTPSYMAPEQLAGRSATAQSDIYALGLVLYELFTGERAFKARSAAEMERLQQDSTPATPSSVIQGLDPAVERTVLSCLEREPADRPPTALAVAAALPGGDPLAAALAAGETPSPELVAAAGEADAMNPAHALALAALAVALFLGAAWLNGRNDLRAYVPIDKPPAAMVDRAQEVIAKLGYTESVYRDPADTAFGYNIWVRELNDIESNDKSPDRWAQLQSPDAGVVSFWYRQSPTTMIPKPQGDRVGRSNPWPATTGGILVSLDPAGRLRFFVHTPRRYHTDPWPSEEPDWSLPFELAALDRGNFERAEPRYQRFMAPEQRAAWVGELPGQP
ncbi:MAG: protein kinase, partial [Acidobacteria bacterium]|nr:protein kinase [Acidobacteriota bacterium]